MANTQNVKTVNLVTGQDLQGDYGSALKLDDGRVEKVTLATDIIIGILAENPSRATGDGTDSVPVALIGGGGVGRVKLGSNVSIGELLVPHAGTGDDAGCVEGVASAGALAADQAACGIALEAGKAGEFISFLMQHIAVPHTA